MLLVPTEPHPARVILRLLAAIILPIAAAWMVLAFAFGDFTMCAVALVIAGLAYRIRG